MVADASFLDDHELLAFERDGLMLPGTAARSEGHVIHAGAAIWYGVFGSGGTTIVLLHGGLGHSGNWGKQVPAFMQEGFRVVVIDSRGHGRSTRTAEPYSYELMSADVVAVMDLLRIERAILVGWSDGACTALVLGHRQPSRVQGVVFFACNMDPSGAKPFVMTSTIERCLNRHRQDYQRLSATPDAFDSLMEAVSSMQRTQPNYTAAQLEEIVVPVSILQAAEDEFIVPEHAEYLHAHIAGSQIELLPGVSHFAPLQRPFLFNEACSRFVRLIGTQPVA